MPIHCLYWHFSKKCYIFIVKSGFLGKITKNFDKITKIATALSGKIVDIDLPPNIISLYKYAPLTSCDVERSFSIYKSILVDNRKRFKLGNLEMYMICHCIAFSDVNDE